MEKILVTTQELADHLDDPRWVVFDVRHDLADVEKGRRAYDAGHIPGAYFLHLDRDLAGPKDGSNGRHPLPDMRRLAKKLADHGVAPGTQVVAYDDAGGSFAVRLWWMLRWLGHERAAVLDGGFPLWAKEGRPVEAEAPTPRKGDFTPRADTSAAVDVHYVERTRGDDKVSLIDARAPDRYAGRVEPIDPVGGHVPGAVNRFWQKNLRADGRFKPAHELRDEFRRLLGEADPSRVVHMCGSGVTACHNIFAMTLAGLPAGRLYPGSWSEWCADPSRPVARGD
jgi:thiosulfate/3-mercaptopyruvate sulfurtransferase